MMQKSDKPIWKKNLYILSIAVFIAGIAFSEIMPFLPLYIDTLGHFTHQQLNFVVWIYFLRRILCFSHYFSLVGKIS